MALEPRLPRDVMLLPDAVLDLPIRAVSAWARVDDTAARAAWLRYHPRARLRDLVGPGARPDHGVPTHLAAIIREVITRHGAALALLPGRLWTGMGDKEVRAWLAGRGLPTLADLPIQHLPGLGLTGRPYRWWATRVAHAFDTSGKVSRHARVPSDVQIRVAAILDRLTGAEVVARPLPPLPADPGLAAEVGRLRAWAEQLRGQTRPRPSLGTRGSFVLHPEQQTATWRCPDGIPCERTMCMATLRFDRHEATCGCPGGPCRAVVEALVAFEALLTGGDRRARRLVEAVGARTGERALSGLDRVLAEAAGRSTPVDRFLFEVRGSRVLAEASTLEGQGGERDPARPGSASRAAAALIRAGQPGEAWPLLVGHPQVYRSGGRDPVRDPVRHVVIAARLSLRLEPLDAGWLPRLHVRGLPWTSDAVLPGRAETTTAAFVDEVGRQVLVVVLDRAAASVVDWVAHNPGVLPPGALDGLLQRLPALSRVIDVEVDERLSGEAVVADPEPFLRLAADGPRLQVELRVRPVAGGTSRAPGQGERTMYTALDGRRVHAVRDLDEERSRAEALAGALRLAEGPQALDGEVAGALLERLGASPGLRVEWSGPPRAVRAAAIGGLRLRVDRHGDRYHLKGGLVVDGLHVPLVELLETLRLGRRYVSLPSGDHVALSGIAEGLRAAADQVVLDEAGASVSPWAAPALLALREAGAVVEADPTFTLSLDRLQAALAMVVPPPPGLEATLRPYQRHGVDWLVRTAGWAAGAVLADDMGLGKTVQAVSLLLHRSAIGPALVVAPTSMGDAWVRETGRFAPSLRVVLARDGQRQAIRAPVGPGDVLVTSWALLDRDIEALSAASWATVVLDEAQALKNPGTARAQAALRLGAAFTLLMTGTPVENRPDELWSLFRHVAPGLLGSAAQFASRWGRPEARPALSRIVRPFLLRRRKAEVAPELPPRTDMQVDVELSEGERALYEELREAARALARQPSVGSTVQLFAALTRLRQAALHPRLVRPESALGSSKVERLVELLLELRAEGEQVLVFSQFTSLLAHVRAALDAAGLRHLSLEGSTPAPVRAARVQAFQLGEADVFLLSLGAGGTGLTLTRASSVVHLDPWWNPAVEDQATDRAHRIGQERPVTVWRLVARDTIEEAILGLHAAKREMVAGLLDGTGEAATLDAAALVALLAEGGGPTNDRGVP